MLSHLQVESVVMTYEQTAARFPEAKPQQQAQPRNPPPPQQQQQASKEAEAGPQNQQASISLQGAVASQSSEADERQQPASPSGGADAGAADEDDDVFYECSGRTKTRSTLCVSSQVGCQMGCTFCATGELDLTRKS